MRAARKDVHCAIAHRECSQRAEVSEVLERQSGVRTLRLFEIGSRYSSPAPLFSL